MSEDPPWIQHSETKGYCLNDTERDYCANNNRHSSSSSTYSADKEFNIRSSIRRKRIRLLPDRIQDLLDDIALINYTDEQFIDTAEWDDLLEDITTSASRFETVATHLKDQSKSTNSLPPGRNIHYRHELTNDSPPPDQELTDLGYDIGRLFGSLLENADRPHFPIGLLWGILLGLTDHHGSEEYYLRNAPRKYIEMLSTRQDHREQAFGPSMEILEHEGAQKLENLLEDRGIDPSIIKPRDLDALLFRDWWELSSDRLDEVLDTYQPIIEQIFDLYDDLEADLDSIRKEGMHEQLSAYHPIQDLWDGGSPQSSTDLTARGKDNHDQITGIMNRLSSTSDHDLWTTRPVVEGSKENWSLTAYGTLLAYAHSQDTLDWLPAHILDYAADEKMQTPNEPESSSANDHPLNREPLVTLPSLDSTTDSQRTQIKTAITELIDTSPITNQ